MVAAQVTFAVVGHHRRAEQAHRLAESLNAKLFIDDSDHGANWNHLRVIKWAADQSARVVVLEMMPIPWMALQVLRMNGAPDSLMS